MLLTFIRAQSTDLVPSGTSDDAALIQSALDNLQEGDTLRLTGDFVIGKTIYLPSHFTWILNGSLTLTGNADLDEAGWVDPPVDATRRTGITEKTGGATNIDMSGGTYDGNAASYGKSMRFINFVSVTNSRFHDMHITDATDDNFTLGPGCNNNVCRNLIGSFAGGNALTDKGDYNKWYDCIAEDCESDGWTPKCRNSEFYRCIGRRNAGPGFGCFARLDGSGNPVDLGETIEGNKFYACEAYDNQRGGFSFNIASTSGEGAIIRNNYIQGIFYNNQMQGLGFRNKQEDGILDSNEVDILVYGNKGLKDDGTLSSYAGGLGVEGEVNGITGSIVAFENGGYDVNINTATNCTISVYNPDDRDPGVLRVRDNSSSLDEIPFSCSQSPDVWCVRKYCNLQPVFIPLVENEASPLLSQNYPNPFHETATIAYRIPVRSSVSLKVYDPSGRELSTLVYETRPPGEYITTIHGSSLPEGTYYYRLIAGKFTETRRFTIVK
jgi:hypothetical protein